jgi:DsbC/DsbD-like thiol-disulfide interchange protein
MNRAGLGTCGLVVLCVVFGCRPEQNQPSSEATPRENTTKVDQGIPTPTRENPVSVTGEVAPRQATPGSRVLLIIRMQTAPGWHIYALSAKEEPVDPVAPTRLDLRLPPGIQVIDDWQSPEAEEHSDTFGRNLIYAGDLEFRRQLQIDDHQVPGPLDLSCLVSYQTCDEFSCLRPKPVELKFTIDVIGTVLERRE